MVPISSSCTVNSTCNAANDNNSSFVFYGSSGITITLPASLPISPGWIIAISNSPASTANLTVAGNGNNVNNAAANLILHPGNNTTCMPDNVTTGNYSCPGVAPGQIVPSGAIILLISGSCPSNFTEVAALDGQMLFGTLNAHGDVGGTGGSNSITPAGTVAAPTFTGASDTTSSVGAGTPAGSNTLGAFSEGAISWPAGVPTNASGAFAEGAISAVSVTSVNTAPTTGAGPNVTKVGGSASTFTPTIAAGVFTQPTISWPAGVPTIAAGSFTQPTFTGSALAGHTHTVTPTGTNSAPPFSGASFDPHPAYTKVIFCSAN